MKLETVPVPTAPDRSATPDEIRSAISLLSRWTVEPSFEVACEIPADSGGYVRISEEDLEAVAASEADSAWTEYLEYWSNIEM